MFVFVCLFFTKVVELLFHLPLKKGRKTDSPQDLSLQITVTEF